MSSSSYIYSDARREQKEELRAAILAAAAKLLATHGPSGLSTRAIAAEVGASTKVIYSHFGGKPGITAALYDDGFSRLAEVLATAAEEAGTPQERLQRVARAYRAFAISAPHLYELMYGPLVRELLPNPEHREAARRSLEVSTSLFREGQEEGVIRSADPVDQARSLWAVLHGTVSLELTTWFDEREGAERLDRIVAMVLAATSTDSSPDGVEE